MVNRKSSTGPTNPPASRTNSSTASPTLKAKRGEPADSSPNNSPLRTNVSVTIDPAKDPVGPEFDDPPKFVQKRNSPQRQVTGRNAYSYSARSTIDEPSNRKLVNQRSRKQTRSLANTLLRASQVLIIGGLVVHTAIVCPQDVRMDSALCQTVHDFRGAFRQYVLEPYVYPQFHKAMAYPPVARVYQPLSQVVDPIVAQAKPLANAASIRANAIYLAIGSGLYDTTQPYTGPLRQKYDESISPITQQYLVQPYQEYAHPFLLAVDQYGQVAGRRIEPYLFHAASTIRRTKDEAQPYLAIAWSETLKLLGLLQTHAWQPILDLRRTYVDPAVSRMVQAVQEKADGSSIVEGASPYSTVQDQTETEDASQDTTASEAFESTQPHSVATGAITATPPPTDPPQVDQSREADDDLIDEDLEAFLQELTSSATDAEPEPEPSLPPVLQTENPEDAEERRRIREAETAEKRLAITGRHDVWEQKLRALSESHVERFSITLAELRKGAVSNLESYKHVESVEVDAERALRNTEAFVKRLVAQGGSQAEKVQKLEDLAIKVKKRFEDGASVLSDDIAGWWQTAQAAEHEEIEKVVKEVRDLGTNAQGDLGLDYSWLDDVTVHDWARYHELLQVPKLLQERLTQMMNGGGQDAPSVNSLSQALQDLQVELQRVVVRFQNQLSNVQRQGVESIMGPPL